jgi:hypothetical protein
LIPGLSFSMKGRDCLVSSSSGFLSAVVLLMLTAAASGRAAIVWTGPQFFYSQPTPDPTQASNQDRLTPDVWLTRASSKGLFNAYSEAGATAFSPSNTEWAFGEITNYASLHYTNWLTWLNGQSPTNLVGQPAVLHLISDDVYLSFEMTFWASGGSGGFAYERSTPAPTGLSAAAVSQGQIGFTYTTETGFSYVVQGSSDLLDWVSMATNAASGDSLSFSNAVSPAGMQFYRVGRLPVP